MQGDKASPCTSITLRLVGIICRGAQSITSFAADMGPQADNNQFVTHASRSPASVLLLVNAHEQSCSADLASVASTKFCRMCAKTWMREAFADKAPLRFEMIIEAVLSTYILLAFCESKKLLLSSAFYISGVVPQ